MVLFPDMYYKNVQSIDLQELEKNEIKGIAIDVDNTLIDYNQVVSDEVIDWINKAKEAGYKMCILSNSNNKNKVEKVANTLELDYIMVAKKPFKTGFKKVLKHLELSEKNVAVIGDQVFTDVLGANRMNMISIYVEPINTKEYWYTKWKRPIEAFILDRRPNKNVM